jgi:hypothetical protein
VHLLAALATNFIERHKFARLDEGELSLKARTKSDNGTFRYFDYILSTFKTKDWCTPDPVDNATKLQVNSATKMFENGTC